MCDNRRCMQGKGITYDTGFRSAGTSTREPFDPETEYKCDLKYRNLNPAEGQLLRIKTLEHYGFTDNEYRHYDKKRELSADEYVSWISTHCGHINLREPDKSKLYAGIKDAVWAFGNKIILYDTIELYLSRKP